MEFREVLSRRTIRRFKQEPLSREELRQILEAARLSSCAANLQRLRYVAVTSPEAVAAITANCAFGMMVKPRRQPVQGVTSPMAYIAVCCDEEPSPMLYADAGAAIQSMELAAWDLGIGACWLGSHRQDAVAEILKIANPATILFVVAFGRPGEAPVLEDVAAGESVKYYLDDSDRIHMPKYTVDAITRWV